MSTTVAKTPFISFHLHYIPESILVYRSVYDTVYDTDPALSRYGLNESFFTGIYLVIASVIRFTVQPQRSWYVGRCWISVDTGPLTLGLHWTGIDMSSRVRWVCFINNNHNNLLSIYIFGKSNNLPLITCCHLLYFSIWKEKKIDCICKFVKGWPSC